MKEDQQRAEALLLKFDSDGSGELDTHQLKQLMKHMNNQVEPLDEDVAYVFRQCNTRNKNTLDIAEIVEALSIWETKIGEDLIIDQLFHDFKEDESETDAEQGEIQFEQSSTSSEKEDFLTLKQAVYCLIDLLGTSNAIPTENDVRLLCDDIEEIKNENRISKHQLKLLIEAWHIKCNPQFLVLLEQKRNEELIARQKKASRIRYFNEKQKSEKWMSHFIQSESGEMNKQELAKMMQFMDNGKEPTDAEVNRIFKYASSSLSSSASDRSSSKTTQQVESLYLQQAAVAVSIWKAMIDDKALIENVFNKYDINQNGLLDFSELKLCLMELYGRDDISDQEVGELILRVNESGTGAVSLDELKPVVEEWFYLNNSKKQSLEMEHLQEDVDEATQINGEKSSMCLIM